MSDGGVRGFADGVGDLAVPFGPHALGRVLGVHRRVGEEVPVLGLKDAQDGVFDLQLGHVPLLDRPVHGLHCRHLPVVVLANKEDVERHKKRGTVTFR